MEEVISILLSLADGGEKRTLSVLPVVGMGGVGKTTLVQHVYNDQRVCGRFPSRGWVCVSDDFSVVSLTKRIIESLTRQACQLNEFDAIQSELIEELKERKRFLVVLDDVWNETTSFWDSFLKPFKLAGVEGSAVIVTTRIEPIARMLGTMPFLWLGCLSDDDCWLIFEENAFLGRDPADHMNLVPIGKKIVEKCKGLPLAVKVLASLLRNEFDRDRWEDILESEVWEVPDQHDDMIPALRLSYLHLPSYLKPCFLYASVFPKDHQFGKEQLVQLWMAQGFLQCEGRKQVEDIGNMYFDDLTQRSLFSPSHRFPMEKRSYVMHDLIYDLARHISEGEISFYVVKEEVDEDKFFPVAGRKTHYLCAEKVCHLSFLCGRTGTEGIEWVLQSLSDGEYRGIRSVLSIINEQSLLEVVLSQRLHDDDEELKLLNEMILNLESLRALHLTRGLPDSIGYLRHLRYLNLGGNSGIRRLPETIGMLYNLQLLNLEGCRELESLPESIGGLCNLRYLNLNTCLRVRSLSESVAGPFYLNCNACLIPRRLPESIEGLSNLQRPEIQNSYLSYPRGMSRLTNLRSLVGFEVASRTRGSGEVHGIELLEDMVHLRGRLEIYGLENVVNSEDAVMANLRNKEHIRQLYLNWERGSGDNDDRKNAHLVLENLRPPNGLQELVIENYSGIVFPSWMYGDASSFSRLTRVHLDECIGCFILPPLGQLPSLKRLKITCMQDVARVGPGFLGVGCFPALEVLHFRDMYSWVWWDGVERGNFPRLRELHVSNCPKLQSMVPLYLFRALQKLKIITCISLLHIELRMPSLSSSSSSIEPPPLLKMTIEKCPLARFSPEDEPLLLPDTLRRLSIDSGCPLLLEWCRRDDNRRRLGHIALVNIPELRTETWDSCSRSSSSCDETRPT